VATALHGLRERPYVFTKCGDLPLDPAAPRVHLKAGSIRSEVEGSLRRLGLEAIDLCQVHQADPDEDVEEACGALAELRREGKVRFVGVSNFDVDQLRRAQAVVPVVSLQPPYSLLARTAFWEPPFHAAAAGRALEGEILPFCEREGIGVLAYSPLEVGLLTGAMSRERVARLPPDDWRRVDPRFQEPRLSRTIALVERLRPVTARHGRSLGQLALAWLLHQPAVTGVVVGARRPEQIEQLAGAARFALSEADLGEVDAILSSA
jgi:aryl-alcohol dehydrogenase-like predicted oxidoreductase